MSAYTPQLIANTRTGLELNVEPFLLPNDAYANLENAFLWRGKIIRKGGNTLLGRLGNRNEVLANRVGPGDNYTGNTIYFPVEPHTVFLGDGVTLFQDNGVGGWVVLTGTGNVAGATINYTTGAYANVIFTGAAPVPPTVNLTYNVQVNANSPVMGLLTLEKTAINDEQLVAFDMVKSYLFNEITGVFLDVSFYKGTVTPINWTGSNSQFFDFQNYQGAMFVTNFNPGLHATTTSTTNGDGIRWYDGTGWVNFNPPLDLVPNYLQGARLLFAYKGRLVALNTWEGPTFGAGTKQFPQRARFSQAGPVYYAAPVPAGSTYAPTGNEWIQYPAGAGGFIDAPTGEHIVAAEFIKDTLVVYFERSTWQLIFSGNDVVPFLWSKINTEFGSTSTFSTVPFDREVLAVGFNGITDCDSVNVNRIDDIIPDNVFGFTNANQGQERVQGIRDYVNELTFWTYVDSENNDQFYTQIFPNRSLLYNYIDRSFAIFRQSYTAFGYFKNFRNLTWGNFGLPWGQASVTWGSPNTEIKTPIVVAGNQQGYVFIIQTTDGNFPIGNATSLSITNITLANPSVFSSINHNLRTGDFVLITNIDGPAGVGTNGIVFTVVPIDADSFILLDVNANPAVIPAAYTFGGNITVVDNFNIQTKQFNFGLSEGVKTRLGYVDMYLENTDLFSEFVADFYVNSYQITTNNFDDEQFVVTQDPIATADQTWFRVFTNVTGQFFTIVFRYTSNFVTLNNPIPGLMFNYDIVTQDMRIQAMMLWTKPAGRIAR